MLSALNHFRTSINRVRELVAIHDSVKAQATAALDLSDILRAALVLAVSAFDFYIHEVVTLGMLEIYRGQRAEPNISSNSTLSAFSRFQVSLGGTKQERLLAISIDTWLETEIERLKGTEFLESSHEISDLTPIISNIVRAKFDNTSWLENEIREKLSFQSFQQPNKVADAIRRISDKKLWDEVGLLLEMPAGDVKQQLSAVVDRRNKIAHEADIDPTFGIGERWRIDRLQVNDATNFIEKVVESIHHIL